MDISAIQSSAQVPSPKDAAGLSNLTSEDFLKLVVAQFANQDPTDVISNENFILQLSQLTTLEQTQGMSQSITNLSPILSLSTSASMIGKEVEFINPEINKKEMGIVENVQMKNGKVDLLINGINVPHSNILTVYNQPNNNSN